MKLDGLTAFVTIADTGSISAAVRLLRLSKSAVSERLTELERTLGATLVQRTSRQFALTEDGLAMLERARCIVTEAEDAKNALAQRRGEISGPLRVSAPRGFGDTHLGPALYSLMARFPAVCVTADFDDRLGDAPAGYDAIIRGHRARAGGSAARADVRLRTKIAQAFRGKSRPIQRCAEPYMLESRLRVGTST